MKPLEIEDAPEPTSQNGATLWGQLAADDIHTPKPHDVRGYLERFPDTEPVVSEVCAGVRRFFGPSAELVLDLNRDPEIDDPFLILFVRLDEYSLATMQQIDEACQPFEEALANTIGYLLVTTDFHRKRPHAV
jgi:hypothetical protein